MAARKESSAPGTERESDSEPTNLEEVLDSIQTAARSDDDVSFGDVFRAVGQRSFGPLLLLAGVITLAPIVGDIPGVPTAMAVVVLLIASQMLLRREHFWLPRWLLDRSMASQKVNKAAGWLRKPARFIDRFVRPRLLGFVCGVGEYAIAIVALLIALLMPVMEVVPFSANAAGAVLTAFGLALIARDGVVALVGLGLTGLSAAVAVFALV